MAAYSDTGAIYRSLLRQRLDRETKVQQQILADGLNEPDDMGVSLAAAG